MRSASVTIVIGITTVVEMVFAEEPRLNRLWRVNVSCRDRSELTERECLCVRLTTTLDDGF